MPPIVPEPAVSASLDVALWLLDRARAADGHLPAQKLQNLLYLACAHFERENDGRPLIPAVFVANEVTVAEPNLYRLLEEGRPAVRVEPVSSAIDEFLAAVWKRYAHCTVEHLNTVVRRAIDGDVSIASVSKDESAEPSKVSRLEPQTGKGGPAPLRPTHRGRQVVVSPWLPPTVTKNTNK
jgi:uncharacterized phage-associated protein